MQATLEIVRTAHPPTPVRLVLESFDSAEECSFHHWIEVCRLVDEGDEPSALNDTQVIAELEPGNWN